MTDKELVAEAMRVRENAYAPYSGFHVGAALECADGTVYTGCNVECGSYGATVCAERMAFGAAIAAGKRSFTRLAVTASEGGFCTPCGICRQFIFELAPEIRVLCAAPEGEWREFGRDDLLPNAFELGRRE